MKMASDFPRVDALVTACLSIGSLELREVTGILQPEVVGSRCEGSGELRIELRDVRISFPSLIVHSNLFLFLRKALSASPLCPKKAHSRSR